MKGILVSKCSDMPQSHGGQNPVRLNYSLVGLADQYVSVRKCYLGVTFFFLKPEPRQAIGSLGV